MRKIAIFFPGIGYTADKPLLYYSRRLAVKLGYEIKMLSYHGFPPKIRGDAGKMREAYRIAGTQTEAMLADVDLEVYEDILFVGKSIGTAVAAKTAAESPVKDRIRLVLYTPLEETFRFPCENAVAFTGTADPWVGKEKSRIADLCAQKGISCHRIPGGNHSLETTEIYEDLRNLKEIMEETETFLKSR